MAEIKIERKERAAIWPWIIAAIIVLLLLWWWASHRHQDNDTAVRTVSTTTMTSGGTVASAAGGTGASTSVNNTGAAAAGAAGAGAGMSAGTAAGAPAAVTEFSTWVATVDPNRDEAKQHAYTAGGIRRLADALAAEGATGSALDNMRKQADALQSSSPNSTRHADLARAAFISAADAFAAVAASHPGVAADTATVRSAAMAMKPGAHLLDQKDKVQSFFESARTALQSMSQTS